MLHRYPRSFYLTVAANVLFFVSSQWSFVRLPSFVRGIGRTATDIGLAYGLFTLSAVLSRPAMGWLVDHRGRKPLLVAGAAIFCLSPTLYALLHSLGPFLTVRLLHGLGIAAFTTAYTALVADLAPPERRGEAIGLSGATNNLGLVFAPALGAAVASRWGHAAHFLAAAAVATSILVVLTPVVDPTAQRPKAVRAASFRSVARLRTVQAATLGSTGLVVAYGAVLRFLSPLATERGLSAAGEYFTAFALAMIAAQALAGWSPDRVGRRALAAPGLALAALAMMGLAAARTSSALLAAGAALGLAWALVRAGLGAAVVDAVSADARGTALSFLYTCFDLGVGAGSFGLGIMAQAQGYGAAFRMTAGWAVVALIGYVAWDQRKG